MNVSQPFVLKEDIVLIPCAELSDDVRRRIAFDDGDYTLSHRHGRARSQVIDGQTAALLALFRNELAILRHLDGSGIAPRPIDAGVHGKRPYLILEWLDGVNALAAAASRRHDRTALLDLCARIADAYATLHARGVLHGDVHPRNIVVAGDRVVLLDFGVARLVDEPPRVGRAGVPFFFEPEHELPSSPAGEQYALAALLYLLIAGRHYLDFRLDREELERQIETDSPAALVDWPEAERILFRALEKDPARRYASIADMARELFLERTLQSLPDAYPPPTASIYFGAAGAAIGLLRISPARADVWRSRAEALIGTEGAYDAGEEVPGDVIGEVSPYHTESGIHAAAAMIAAARGDAPARRRAIEAFLVASRRPCAELDLTLGRSGSLLAAAMLMRIDDDPALRAFGSETMTAIWNARPIAGTPAWLTVGPGTSTRRCDGARPRGTRCRPV